MTARPTIAVTIGEPAGIGPDLCVRLAERAWPARLVLIGDIELLRARARRLGAGVRFMRLHPPRAACAGGASKSCIFRSRRRSPPGDWTRPTPEPCSRTLDAAVGGALSGEFAAMVTAPVQKSVLNDAGYRVHRPHRVSRRAYRGPARRNDARRRPTGADAARRARDDAPAARRGAGGDHARIAGGDPRASSPPTSRANSASRARASRSAA